MSIGGTTDILVIGGGINGAGIARDAAGRGLSVVLCEQGDLANATSSASSKLIHGGLRYLEYYAFRLVREALAEREVLYENAPHIIFPIRFVLPHEKSLRPAWLIRAGLFLYDHLGGRRRLPGSHGIDLHADPEGAPLREEFGNGFVYSDCWVDDARLVVLNALDAAERGATILTRTRCLAARREDSLWRVRLQDARSGTEWAVDARILVNAAGPWVGKVLEDVVGIDRGQRPRLVKGSHVVVPRLYDGDHAYILQNDDRRVVFVIPYEGDYSLIGTTDVPFDGDPAEVRIDPAETAYLCAAVNRYFATPVSADDVVWSYSGVRPLYDDEAEDAAAVTRDYELDLDAGPGQAPLLSVFGGKITTYRRLAEQALEHLAPYTPHAGNTWTANVPLPGGDIADADFATFLGEVRRTWPWLREDLARRYARAYGTRIETLLEGAHAPDHLGRDFGAGICEREVEYLVKNEWAMTSEDILWRRTKRGLRASAETVAALDDWLAGRETLHRVGAP